MRDSNREPRAGLASGHGGDALLQIEIIPPEGDFAVVVNFVDTGATKLRPFAVELGAIGAFAIDRAAGRLFQAVYLPVNLAGYIVNPGEYLPDGRPAGDGVRERGMRKFNSVKQAQRFLDAHAAVSSLFNLGRHLVSADHYRNLRIRAFTE